MSAAPLPLEGVRVVDFTAYWAGTLPTAIMADLGAEVIKVESIQRPDQFRILATAVTRPKSTNCRRPSTPPTATSWG